MTDEQFKAVVQFMNDYRAALEKIISQLEQIRERQR